MPPGDTTSHLDDEDTAFERRLLGSARADLVSEGAVQDAWSRFAASAGAIASIDGAAVGHAQLVRATRYAALKGLVVGALCGGALTLSLMGRQTRSTPSPSAANPSVARIAATALPAVDSVHPDVVERTSAIDDTAKPDEAASQTLALHAGAEHAPRAVGKLRDSHAPTHSNLPASQSGETPSTLDAEVAALDAVRLSLDHHDWLRATRLVDAYHRDFPRGQLSADAEVLAIEALASEGNHAEVARRAARFLSRYPRDPHVSRIEALSRD